MKKYLLISLLILSLSGVTYALEADGEVAAISPEDLQEETFFRSPMSKVMPDIRQDPVYRSFDTYSSVRSGVETSEIDSDKMPWVKQMRLKATSKWAEITSEDKPTDKNKKTIGQRLSRFKFWENEEELNDEDVEFEAEEGSIAHVIQNKIANDIEQDKQDGVVSLESGISEQVTEKQLQLDSDNVYFDEDTSEMVADGRPKLYLPPQNITVIADKMTYNEDSNILKAIGDVLVLRDGMPTKGDYFEVDMNEESMFMDNVESKTESMMMNARVAKHENSLLILEDGNFHSDVSEIHRMSARMIGPRFINMQLSEDERSYFLSDPRGNKLHINAEKIYVDARENHDVFTVKNMEIRRQGKYWFSWPSLTAYTDKERKFFEANYPELGTKRKVGMFIGPGFVFSGPGGSVMKAIPFLNYQHGDFGFGGALKYLNTFNHTELGYGSAADIFFLKGRQRLDDNLYLQYSSNTFMDEWFMGARMPKYMAEVFYDKGYTKHNFLAPGKTLTFRHRAGFGFMEDNDRNYYGEKFKRPSTSTSRTRYMAEIRQGIYSYANEEKDFYFDFGFVMQGSAAIYGNGDTQFVGRVGPTTHIQYKNWMQDLAYFQAGYEDNTPLPRFDAYRYGSSSVRISEIIRLNKYFSVGWQGMANLSNDSPNGKIFQENRFVFALGPDDLKIRLGYDFVRRTTYFGFDVAFDTKGTSIDYGRMEIKNPERLGKRKEREAHKNTFTPAVRQVNELNVASKQQSPQIKPKRAVLRHAQVLDIEDPIKEMVQ
ncbi:MAG: LPS-assembly protein LptD [Cyanobacteria bacterium SIG26]|nr:LPS-assembly protein LptD [Cyanobacteria bacterium SIG26]